MYVHSPQLLRPVTRLFGTDIAKTTFSLRLNFLVSVMGLVRIIITDRGENISFAFKFVLRRGFLFEIWQWGFSPLNGDENKTW